VGTYLLSVQTIILRQEGHSHAPSISQKLRFAWFSMHLACDHFRQELHCFNAVTTSLPLLDIPHAFAIDFLSNKWLFFLCSDSPCLMRRARLRNWLGLGNLRVAMVSHRGEWPICHRSRRLKVKLSLRFGNLKRFCTFWVTPVSTVNFELFMLLVVSLDCLNVSCGCLEDKKLEYKCSLWRVE
jgi:hypothetical protein